MISIIGLDLKNKRKHVMGADFMIVVCIGLEQMVSQIRVRVFIIPD